MKTKINFIIATALLLSLFTKAQDGASLFKQNCAVCHTIGKGKLVGPDLKGSHAKYEEKWLLNWIKSSQSMVKKGDPTAVKVFEENNKMVMPDQSLTDADIKTVIAFVKSESEKPEAVAETPGTPATEKPAVEVKSEPYDYKSKPSSPLSWQAATYTLAGFCILLVVVIIAMGQIIKTMANSIPASNTSPEEINEKA